MQQAGVTLAIAGKRYRIITAKLLVPDTGEGADLALYTLVDDAGQRYTTYGAQFGTGLVTQPLAPVAGYTEDQVAAGIEQMHAAWERYQGTREIRDER